MIKLYLCSQSPRRRELISKIHNNYECLSIGAEEPRYQPEQSPKEYLKLCLSHKASEAEKIIQSIQVKEALILVADTIVVFKKEVLGKPLNRNDAKKILSKLSGQRHEVQTGFVLLHWKENKKTAQIERVVSSQVKFLPLDQKIINSYVKSGDADDKAGAYGFQAGALRFVEEVSGSYSNIMGLPVLEVEEEISNMMKEILS